MTLSGVFRGQSLLATFAPANVRRGGGAWSGPEDPSREQLRPLSF